MAKLKREALLSWLDSAWHAHYAEVTEQSAANWVVIGDDIEDMAIELNPDTEQIKNILGQSKVRDNGYEPSFDADPFYADPDNALYPKIRDIALERKQGDDCKTLLLEVIIEDTEATSHKAFVREVFVKPQSYGGDTSGVNIPYTVTEDGKNIEGTVTAASVLAGAPVFTAAT